ncbi:hypothetical protein HOF67_02045 [Candidatus Peregrinibacteria bacterium]|jgi:hypothetical protein|nr:hypothetical protein [Candidatus Peregrinibacteria bacterium]
MYPCFGLEILGNCNYDPSNPPYILFSIGEAIAAFSLAVIVHQFLSPELKFRIKLNLAKYYSAITLFILGVLLPIVAAILPNINGQTIYFLGYPIFWEILGGVFIVSAMMVFIFIYRLKPQYSKKNCQEFLNYTVAMISTNDKTKISALAKDLYYAANSLILFASKYNRYEAITAERKGEKYEIDSETEIAVTILQAISDENFCKMLACNYPSTINKLITALEKYKCGVGYAFIQQLAAQSFIQSDSILSREKDYEGLGTFKGITRIIFGNAYILNNFSPFNSWRSYEDKYVTLPVIDNYTRALKFAVKKNSDFSGLGHALESITMPVYLLLKKVKSNKEGRYCEEDRILDKIMRTLGDIIEIVEENMKGVVIQEREIPLNKDGSYDRFKDSSVYGSIAVAIFELLEKLAVFTDNDDYIRDISAMLWFKIFLRKPATGVIHEIQKRLWLMIKKRITENLKEFHYSSMIRLMLNYGGVSYFSNEEERSKAFPNDEVLNLLKQYLKEAFEKDCKKAEQFLPTGMNYDYDTNELSYETYQGEVLKLLLDEVKPTAEKTL